MHSKRVADCFGDIVTAIDLILTWVEEAGGIEAAIHHNVLVRNAIERQLLVVSEAAIRLHKLAPEAESTLTPEVDWPGVRGIGNFIRHKYDDLDVTVIADVLRHRLGGLRVAVKRAQAQLSRS
jgi:uncharacterized protein with HEPN domain